MFCFTFIDFFHLDFSSLFSFFTINITVSMMQYSLTLSIMLPKAPKSECLKNQAILWSLFWCEDYKTVRLV